MKDLKFPFSAKASLVFLGLIAFICVLYIAQDIIIPFIYASIIAIALNPAVNYLTRKKINRSAAISIILLALVFFILLIVLLLSSQLIELGEELPALVEKFDRILNQSVSWVSEYFNISTRKINVWVAAKKLDILADGNSSLGQTLLNTGNALIVLILIPIYVYMILYYQPLLREFLHRIFKSGNLHEVDSVLSSIKKVIQSYLSGLLLEAVIVGFLNTVSLLILGIDYAILLGVVGALLNVIPYIGGLIAVALPMMIALATKDSGTYCLLVLGVYFVIQLIDNNYIIPKIVASKVKINALASTVAILAGGALWGMAGMFLSIPLIAITKVIFDQVVPLKPWGYLIGDTMPESTGLRYYLKLIVK